MALTGMTDGYRALREGAACLDLSGRGKIRATGEDHVRLLHAMTTNSVQDLPPGEGCYALFLNAQGRMLADVNLLRRPDHVLLDTEPETAQKVYAHLDKYIIADDVSLEDVTAETATIGVEGPGAREVLARIAAPLPDKGHQSVEWNSSLVARLSATGAESWWIFLQADAKAALIEQLTDAGAVPSTADDVRAVRLENGRPRYGEDLTEGFIPNEAQIFRALHFTKGCYLGQEIIERVRARGQVHRLLVKLQIYGAQVPSPGSELTADGKKAGEITSAAYSPSREMIVALGYVRDVYASPGTNLLVGSGSAATVTGPPSG